MPMGGVTIRVPSGDDAYPFSPLPTVGAVALVQSSNGLTIRELALRGAAHHVLRNMRLADTRDTDVRDKRARLARAIRHRKPVQPVK